MTTWYRVTVPFDVQAPDGLSNKQLRNQICELISNRGIKLPTGWTECSAITADEEDITFVHPPRQTSRQQYDIKRPKGARR